MRKYRREMLRREAAKKQGVKPSAYVHFAWNLIQNKLVGEETRARNKARGTHKRKTWRARVTAASRIRAASKKA